MLSLSAEPLLKRKYSLLPLLVLLFCVSYGILTLLVVEQGRTIDSQKSLIRQLFQDSTKLNAMRMQQATSAFKAQHPAPKPQAQPAAPPIQPGPQSAAPRDMQTQAPVVTEKIPEGRNRGTSKLRRRSPLKPPKGLAEEGDERRAVLSI